MMNVNAPETAPIVVMSDPKLAARKRFDGLTPREYQIAIRIAQGQRQATIAQELSISKKTVQTHRERALLALGVGSSAEVAILAFQAGLVSAP